MVTCNFSETEDYHHTFYWDKNAVCLVICLHCFLTLSRDRYDLPLMLDPHAT